jgi:NAD(P)-dependent dehydrogenase (short-subunit alcohol dehydrogenase family)
VAPPFQRTDDGFELQLAANHLGHFLLTNLIMPKVLPSQNGISRVVIVASSGNKYCDVQWADPNFEQLPNPYTPFLGYGQSKTANVLFAIALNARLASPPGHPGLHAYALNPGSAATGLQVNMTPELVADSLSRVIGRDPATGEPKPRPQRKTLQQACATTLRAALDPDLPAQRGVWLNDCQLTDDKDPNGLVASWALDPQAAERCWKLSEDLLGEHFEY